ncbi:MAG TPA: M48 family metalloprotease [Gaiellaceae bacterium]|nr:M48 family metalloprotease [Gaiellaceae bacterium]
MTATRIGVGTLTALWLLAAYALWQTEVPGDLDVHSTLAPFASLDLTRAGRHDEVLRLLTLASIALQLVALALLVRFRPRVRGRPVLRAAQLGGLAAVVLVLARLPVGAVALWWQRRYGIAQLDYGTWLFDQIGPLLLRVGLLGFAAALCFWLAGRFGGRWWLAALPVFAVAGTAVILAQPLLTPRTERVRRLDVVRQVERLAAREGLPRPEVEVLRTKGRTRQLNAEALGIGPTTRVILWQTTLALPAAERAFLVAHELGHVRQHHLWKGLAWFVLLLAPGLALLAWIAPLRIPEDVPRVLLTAYVLLTLATPIVNTLSRRYEAEADWVGLETARNPRAAQRFFADVAKAGVRDPEPPRWWTLVFGTHPSLAERAGMADAFSRARSRGGS